MAFFLIVKTLYLVPWRRNYVFRASSFLLTTFCNKTITTYHSSWLSHHCIICSAAIKVQYITMSRPSISSPCGGNLTFQQYFYHIIGDKVSKLQKQFKWYICIWEPPDILPASMPVLQFSFLYKCINMKKKFVAACPNAIWNTSQT